MEKDKKYTIFQNLLYYIRAVREGYPNLLVLCIVIVFVNGLIPIITTFLPKVVIDMIINENSVGRLLIVTGILTIILAVMEGTQKYLERLIYWHKFKMNTFFIRKVTQKGLTTDYMNLQNEHYRKLQQESFSSCNGNFSYFNQICDTSVKFFSNFFGFVAFLGILITLNPVFILFLCATTLIAYIFNRKIAKWLEYNMEEKSAYEQEMQYVINVANDVRAAKDIRLYNMSVWMNTIYEKNLKGVLGWYRRYTGKLFGVAAVDSGLTLAREGVTYAFLIYMTLKNQITVAEFVLYFNVVAGFSTWLSSMLGELGNLERLNMSVNRFRSYLEYPEYYLRKGGKLPRDTEKPSKIELENVSLRYEGNDDEVISDMNIVIEPGEHLAIVGLNGAGKTSLVRLIAGLMEPSAGSVLYDGIDIREYNRDEYYQLFGAVFQSHSILPVSIEEIVSEDIFGTIDEIKVEKCLRDAGLWEKIESLEHGIKSKYDKAFWNEGINLSGGQIQKLLLARALYRQSPVIILDEPTAALDPISENRLYETYDNVMKGKTTIFISHRLASTRFCNRIILIEEGRIVEEGTHEELLRSKGRYYELFETQAKYYRENPSGKEKADEA